MKRRKNHLRELFVHRKALTKEMVVKYKYISIERKREAKKEKNDS
jgi:hypothetical protein